MQTAFEIKTYGYRDLKTYVYATIFAIANVAAPQIAHLIPDGGHIWLPIYFFTLVSAYRLGWKAGVLTALLSPVANCLMFSMPAIGALPLIMAKSAVLALMAGSIARLSGRLSLVLVAMAVISGHAFGMAIELIMTGSPADTILHLQTGLPGILLEIFGGYVVIKWLFRADF